VRVGDLVPDFELPDQDGTPHSLARLLADGPVVLFFYPAALTPGCTREACHFRDIAAEYAAAGVPRVGISRDAVARQKQFADRYDLDYPLLSDADGRVADLFGVTRGGLLGRLGPVKRRTFAIGTDRRVAAVIASETNMAVHADQALRALADSRTKPA
jgi:peroxiredoxin Q/BCP